MTGPWADLSADGMHRYSLGRFWSPGPMALFVMLNPSTADARDDDPTIRRCTGFARNLGAGSFAVVNLYSYRTPDPADLVDAAGAGIDVTGGQENDSYIEQYIGKARTSGGPIIAAWGAFDRPAMRSLHRRRIDHVRQAAAPMYCLGVTKQGQPRHPLYLPASAPLTPFPARPTSSSDR